MFLKYIVLIFYLIFWNNLFIVAKNCDYFYFILKIKNHYKNYNLIQSSFFHSTTIQELQLEIGDFSPATRSLPWPNSLSVFCTTTNTDGARVLAAPPAAYAPATQTRMSHRRRRKWNWPRLHQRSSYKSRINAQSRSHQFQIFKTAQIWKKKTHIHEGFRHSQSNDKNL